MIDYSYQETELLPYNFKEISNWISYYVSRETKECGDINYIFCTDEIILETNRKYLQHDYYTDVITFDYCEGDLISGDIFVSLDTVKSNSELYSKDFTLEFLRVLIHGVLHLIGYNDKSDEEIKVMRAKEEDALRLINVANL